MFVKIFKLGNKQEISDLIHHHYLVLSYFMASYFFFPTSFRSLIINDSFLFLFLDAFEVLLSFLFMRKINQNYFCKFTFYF